MFSGLAIIFAMSPSVYDCVLYDQRIMVLKTAYCSMFVFAMSAISERTKNFRVDLSTLSRSRRDEIVSEP